MTAVRLRSPARVSQKIWAGPLGARPGKPWNSLAARCALVADPAETWSSILIDTCWVAVVDPPSGVNPQLKALTFQPAAFRVSWSRSSWGVLSKGCRVLHVAPGGVLAGQRRRLHVDGRLVIGRGARSGGAGVGALPGAEPAVQARDGSGCFDGDRGSAHRAAKVRRGPAEFSGDVGPLQPNSEELLQLGAGLGCVHGRSTSPAGVGGANRCEAGRSSGFEPGDGLTVTPVEHGPNGAAGDAG